MPAPPAPRLVSIVRTDEFLSSAAEVAKLYGDEPPLRDDFDERFVARVSDEGITLFAERAALTTRARIAWREIESIDHGMSRVDTPTGLEVLANIASTVILGGPVGWGPDFSGIVIRLRISVPSGSALLRLPIPDRGSGLPIPGAVAAFASHRPRDTAHQVPDALRRGRS